MKTLKKWLRRLVVGVLVLVCISICVGAIWHRFETRKTLEKYPPMGEFYDAGGHRLHLLVMGEEHESEPVVVIDCGIGGGGCSGNFELRDELAKFTKVCVFDRAGYGWSDAGAHPRLPSVNVAELRLALKNAGLKPPYLLLGQSLGGLNMRYFASKHPDEVAGLVLEDALAMDAWEKDEVPLPSVLKLFDLGRGIGLARLVGLPADPNPPADDPAKIMTSELALQSKSYHAWYGELLAGRQWKQIQESMCFLDKMPVTVLVAKKNNLPFGKGWWADGQKALQSISSNIVVIEADTGHGISDENPQLVINAIREILDRIKQQQQAAVSIEGRKAK